MNRLCMGHLFLFNLKQCVESCHTKMTMPRTELPLAVNDGKEMNKAREKKKSEHRETSTTHTLIPNLTMYINEDVGFAKRSSE